MPQLTLSRRTVLAPTPGLTGQQGPARKAVFGQPGDLLEISGITMNGTEPWFESALVREGQQVGTGYVFVAALFGQPGAEALIAGAYSHG